MTTIASLHFGRFTAGYPDAYIIPRISKNRRLALYLHGAGAGTTGSAMLGTYQYESTRWVNEDIVRAGYPMVGPTITDLWGNATSRTRIQNAITWGRANLTSNAGPVILVGASHGAVNALRFAYTDPTEVACVIGIIPAIHTTWIRDNDPEGADLTAAINAAWGLAAASTAALPAGADPGLNASAFVNIPIQLHVATDDDISYGYSAFASTTGAEVVSLGALGHTAAALDAVNGDDITNFIKRKAR